MVIGSLVGITIPVFFLAFLLKYFFAVRVVACSPPRAGRAPASSPPTPPASTSSTACSPASTTRAWDALIHLVLPGLALGTIPLAIIVRITRASVIEVQSEDYVRTAEAKGLTSAVDHAAGTSCATRCCRCPPPSACSWGCCCPGRSSPRPCSPSTASGRSCSTRSPPATIPVLQGFILFIALVFALVNLLVDMSYGFIDPRVRVS